MAVIEISDFGEQGWKNPAAAAERARQCCGRLESGDILLLPAFPVVDEENRNFLVGVHQTGSSFIKNISYDPASGRIRGYMRSTTDARSLKRVLHDYFERAYRAIKQLLSPYADRLQIDLTSFRPFEEQGRQLRGASRNDLIHVDAFSTRPARGRRILRFFTNVHPDKARVWNTSEPFGELAVRIALDAGLSRYATGAGGLAAFARKALSATLCGIGFPIAKRAPYDEFMLRFHDYLKANQDFQRECPKWRCEFPPGSSWVAFTDTVSHAVVSGQFALEQTFFVPLDCLRLPNQSPLRILESLAGFPLAS